MNVFYQQYKNLFLGESSDIRKWPELPSLNSKRAQFSSFKQNLKDPWKQKLQHRTHIKTEASPEKSYLFSKQATSLSRYRDQNNHSPPYVINPETTSNDRFKQEILPKFDILNKQRKQKADSVEFTVLRKFDQMKQQYTTKQIDDKPLNKLRSWDLEETLKNPQFQCFEKVEPSKDKIKTESDEAWVVKTLPKKRKLHNDITIHSDPITRKRAYQPTIGPPAQSSMKEIMQMDLIRGQIDRYMQKNKHVKKTKEPERRQQQVPNIKIVNFTHKMDNKGNSPFRYVHQHQVQRQPLHIPQVSDRTAVKTASKSRSNEKSHSNQKKVSEEKHCRERPKFAINRNQSMPSPLQLDMNFKDGHHPYQFRSHLELPIDQQHQIQETMASPIQFSEYKKENQYAFVNRRLEDVKNIEHYHPRGHINAYVEALQRRQNRRSLDKQRKIKIKNIIKREQEEFWSRKKEF